MDSIIPSPTPCHHPLWTGTVQVVQNCPVAEKTWRITLLAPEFLPLVRPGQFIMLRLKDSVSPLLGRPFAVYAKEETTGQIDVIYLTVGKMTDRLAKIRQGEELELWGPLGNGWGLIEGDGENVTEPVPSPTTVVDSGERPLPFDHLVMVAGGIGQTPFYMLSREYQRRSNPPKRTLLYGARNKDRIPDLTEFCDAGVDLVLVTEDGSIGRKGIVTPLIGEAIDASGIAPERTTILACGPHPMLAASFGEAKKRGIRCFTSLESPMSCGLGLCYGCVIEYLNEDGAIDYRRTCVDGPVFDAYRLVW